MFAKVIYFISFCVTLSLCLNEESKLRIAGGEFASINEVPYVVRIILKRRGFPVGLCTGAIINESWVLTAAHCVKGMSGFEIQAGIDKLEDEGQVRNGLNWFVHDRYFSSADAKHDIALIEVDPFELSETVKVIQLSGSEWPQDAMYNRSCLAAGWGSKELNDKVIMENLRKLRVTAMHGEQACKCFRGHENRRLVCLGGSKGEGVCTGDSGSALVCGVEAVGVASIIYSPESCSIFSFFKRTKLSCKTTASAYMYICPYLPWIKQHVVNVPDRPASCKGSTLLVAAIIFIPSICYNLIIIC